MDSALLFVIIFLQGVIILILLSPRRPEVGVDTFRSVWRRRFRGKVEEPPIPAIHLEDTEIVNKWWDEWRKAPEGSPKKKAYARRLKILGHDVGN